VGQGRKGKEWKREKEQGRKEWKRIEKRSREKDKEDEWEGV